MEKLEMVASVYRSELHLRGESFDRPDVKNLQRYLGFSHKRILDKIKASKTLTRARVVYMNADKPWEKEEAAKHWEFLAQVRLESVKSFKEAIALAKECPPGGVAERMALKKAIELA